MSWTLRAIWGRRWVRRIVFFGASAFLVLYIGGATAGYLWVKHVRKSTHVTFFDVALLRWREVRRSLATQQFERARIEREAGNHQAAFLAFTFAVNNDPDNVEGRMSAVDYLRGMGSNQIAIEMLEVGLGRAPDHRGLIERTFDILSESGRDRRTLELLARRERDPTDPSLAAKLRTYELQALLNLDDSTRAKMVLEKHPELEAQPGAVPVVARVLWETKERLRAMELLASHLSDAPLSAYSQLVQWQLAMKSHEDAVHTAEQACAKFPNTIAARLLLIDAVAARSFQGREVLPEIERYLKEFSEQPRATLQLGALAARRGWVELARTLYEFGALHQSEAGVLALFYSDALMQNSRHREARLVLADIESQTIESAPPFQVQLRHRQVLVAAALGDSANVREHARRLASALRNDSAGLETSRRHFEKLRIADAVAELGGRTAVVVQSN